MKRINFIIIALVLVAGSLFAAGETWDVLDKSFTVSANWNQDEGTLGKAFVRNAGGSSNAVVTPEDGYVNYHKTSTGQSGHWSWLRPNAILPILPNTPYMIEAKVRIQPNAENHSIEWNQISVRFGGRSLSVFLKHTDGETGSVSSAANTNAETQKHALNTSDWHVYRLIISADKLGGELYIDDMDTPVFTGLTTGTTGDQNGVYFGAEGQHRCNIDVEYAKVATMATAISLLTLSSNNHIANGNTSTVTVTANTTYIDNGEKLLFSLLDADDVEVVAPFEVTVTDNVATADIEIPAEIGIYTIKVAAPNDEIGSTAVAPLTAQYAVRVMWNVMDKLMAAWNADGDSEINKAWETSQGPAHDDEGPLWTQGEAYVNYTKTIVANTYAYAFLRSQSFAVFPATAYTVEIKARAAGVDQDTYPDSDENYEANQLSVRIGGRAISLYLMPGSGEEGSYIRPGTDVPTGGSAVPYTLDITEWHTYRFVLSADGQTYDVYVDNAATPVFAAAATYVKNESGNNFVCFGSEGRYRCNMDVEYVKIGMDELVPDGGSSTVFPALNSTSSISVYPTMLSRGGQLTIQQQGTENLSAEIFDVNGRSISAFNLNGAEGSINAPDAAGLYILRIKTNSVVVKNVRIIVSN